MQSGIKCILAAAAVCCLDSTDRKQFLRVCSGLRAKTVSMEATLVNSVGCTDRFLLHVPARYQHVDVLLQIDLVQKQIHMGRETN